MSLKLPNSRVGRALFLVVCVFAGAYGAYLAVTATDVDLAYRISAPNSAPCQALRDNPKALQKPNHENDENDENADDWWTCALQRHENPPLNGDPAISSLTNRPIHEPGAFHLAFVEFGEDGREIQPLQRDWLFEHLKKQKQNYVVTFVHGWRHDARRGDTNLKSFRTLLSYAKSALEHRCVEAGRYCDATLTGVFVGWRGQVLSHDWEGSVADLIAAPTFFTRKLTSDVVAKGVASFLKDMSSEIHAGDATSANLFQHNHMLSIGHSLGGNILITGLGPDVVDNIKRGPAKKTMRSPAGDLVVLLNPAAEATKWTQIQDAVVQQRGKDFFAPDQRPLVVSLTVACHYTEEQLQKKDDKLDEIKCDTVTGDVFPLYKLVYKLATFNFSQESRVTLGHLDPEGDGKTRVGHGTTHEFDINGSLYKKTEYKLASDPNYSQCRIGDGWLTYAKERTFKQTSKRERWDAGWEFGIENENRFAVDPINDWVSLKLMDNKFRVNAQFRHGIYRGSGPSITAADDPFWNARAIDSVARDHDKIFSPLTWCALHQLVLDDVNGSLLYFKNMLWDINRKPK